MVILFSGRCMYHIVQIIIILIITIMITIITIILIQNKQLLYIYIYILYIHTFESFKCRHSLGKVHSPGTMAKFSRGSLLTKDRTPISPDRWPVSAHPAARCITFRLRAFDASETNQLTSIDGNASLLLLQFCIILHGNAWRQASESAGTGFFCIKSRFAFRWEFQFWWICSG